MAVKSKTKPSTPRLSESARHLKIPEGIVTTGWPRVEAKGLELGLTFDWWQAALGRVVLGKRADGKYAATVGGVVLSIPRQVGKTYFVLALLTIMCILFPGLQVVWTAHHLRVSTRAFGTLRRMMNRPKLRPHLLHARAANGEQEIAFRNGSVVMFGSREKGFRGFDAVDVEVFDEAQMLSEAALEDMVAATNQARHPHGALLFYMGTPPRPIDDGEAFTARRSKAINNRSKDIVYLECSADPGCDPDDVEQWRKANLSYPQRTPHESMLRLRENLANDDGWFREGLGVWDDDALTTIPLGAWANCVDAAGKVTGDVVLSLEMSFDRTRTVIGVAGGREDGRRQVEVAAAQQGTAWVRDALAAACRDFDAPVMVATNGPAAALIPDLLDAGLDVITVSGGELAQACGHFFDSVLDGSLTHLGDDGLLTAVRGAQRRTGESFVFTRRGDVDISPLYAVTLALWGWTLRHANGDVLQHVW